MSTRKYNSKRTLPWENLFINVCSPEIRRQFRFYRASFWVAFKWLSLLNLPSYCRLCKSQGTREFKVRFYRCGIKQSSVPSCIFKDLFILSSHLKTALPFFAIALHCKLLFNLLSTMLPKSHSVWQLPELYPHNLNLCWELFSLRCIYYLACLYIKLHLTFVQLVPWIIYFLLGL